MPFNNSANMQQCAPSKFSNFSLFSSQNNERNHAFQPEAPFLIAPARHYIYASLVGEEWNNGI